MLKRQVKSFDFVSEAPYGTSYGIVTFKQTWFKKEYLRNVYRITRLSPWVDIETEERYPEITIFLDTLSDELEKLRVKKEIAEGFIKAVGNRNKNEHTNG